MKENEKDGESGRLPIILAVSLTVFVIVVVIYGGWFNPDDDDRLSNRGAATSNTIDESEIVVPVRSVSEVEEESIPPSERVSFLHDSYTSFIQAADRGDSEAQLAISMIMERCAGVTKEGASRLETEFKQANVSEEVEREIRFKYESCVPFIEKYGNINFSEMQMAWLETAADNNNKIAKLQTLLDYPDHLEKSNVYPWVEEVVKAAPRNEWTMQRKYELLFKYYAHYIEPEKLEGVEISESNYDRGVDRRAWEYLHCKHSIGCEVEEVVGVMGDYFTQADISAMVDRAEEIESAIRLSDMPGMGL